MTKLLPFRQIHLDFHTSPAIPDVGVDFDPQDFVQTLQSAHVDSVTVFAKCHHGYSYYPTEVGTPHPHLQRDLLGEMIEAAKKAGIRVPIYTTVVWDELAWAENPDWRVVFAEKPVTAMHISNSPVKPGWKDLCMNTPFADYVIAQIEELLDRYDGDGFFVDIIQSRDCVCNYCLKDMLDMGYDPADAGQRKQFGLYVARRLMQRISQAVWDKKPGQSLFFNNRMRMITPAEVSARPEADYFSHFELESLPAILWGYEHFPIYVRYFQTFGKELVGMTSRFDTVWGDFGGLRNRAALEFECFQALAHGATCSIGDQLHPRGAINQAVYRRIGEVYAGVEKREAWCVGTRPLPEIGVFTAASAASLAQAYHGIADVDKGVWRILEQLKHQFQFIDAAVPLEGYRLVILPDDIQVDEALAEKLRAYVSAGGSLLVSGRAGLNGETGDFWLAEEMGVHCMGPAPFTPDYLVPGEDMSAGVDVESTVCYLPGLQVAAQADAEVLALAGKPYFNRTWDHFCSHQYTPMEKVTDEPLIVQKGRLIYIARPLFSDYAQFSRRPHRQVIDHCIQRLLPEPAVGANSLPVTAVATVRQQGDDLILHILNYVPQRRSAMLDVLEDIVPLYDVKLNIRVNHPPESVMLVPERQEIAWQCAGAYAELTIPVVNGYQIVQLKGAA